MTKKIDTSDITKVSNYDLNHLHEFYKIDEATWLAELERRGLSPEDRGFDPETGEDNKAKPKRGSKVKAEEPETPEPSKYDGMDRVELVGIAEARGFEITDDHTAEDIIQALVADDEATESEQNPEA